jgi:hypothetical protein
MLRVVPRSSQEVEMSSHKSLLTVLNPQGSHAHEIEPLELAPRLQSLNEKTVYLVDIGFGGGYEFLEEMRGWFSKRVPAVKTVLERKPGNMLLDEPEFWAELKKRADAVIFGVGG